jgi:pimeloyl-ACP methyl ester carboxylesterase
MARDTATFVEALGLERAHFVGYSMGGAVALQLALEKPPIAEWRRIRTPGSRW